MSEPITDKRTDTARALIGQCLWDRSKTTGAMAARVGVEDMPHPWGDVWAYVKAGVTDVPSLALALGDDTLAACGGAIGLSQLTVYGGGDYSEEHAKKLLNFSARVRMIDIARNIQAQASDPEADAEKLAREAVETFAKMGMNTAADSVSVGEIMADLLPEIAQAKENPQEIWGVPCGLPKFDRMTGGAQAGDFTLLIGEPGVGKTWLGLTMAMGLGKTSPGIIVSLEMKRKAQGYRILSGLTAVPSRAMKTGFITEEQAAKVAQAVTENQNSTVRFTDMRFTTSQLKSFLAREKIKHGITWVVLDYLMLLDLERNADGEIEFTARIARDLKNMAQDLDIAIICLHSVVKSGMDNEKPDPGKSKARGSGQVLHDADWIWHLTKFAPMKDREKLITPEDREKMSTLWNTKGRELEPGSKYIHLVRQGESPFFAEAKI